MQKQRVRGQGAVRNQREAVAPQVRGPCATATPIELRGVGTGVCQEEIALHAG